MACCSSCCQHVSPAGVAGIARRESGRVGAVQAVVCRAQLRERRMLVCGDDVRVGRRQSWQRRGGSSNASVTVSATALAAQEEQEHAENRSDAPVILEVQGLRAVVADTRQEILSGVDLVIREGEVSCQKANACISINFVNIANSLLSQLFVSLWNGMNLYMDWIVRFLTWPRLC